MLTKQQICKLNDVEPTENVLKAMEEWGKQRDAIGQQNTFAAGGIATITTFIILFLIIMNNLP